MTIDLDDEHLDDDALSAALDGVATAGEQAHLASCSRCQAQMASMAAVVRAVGAPITPRPGTEVDAAVEQALAAWSRLPQEEMPAEGKLGTELGTPRSFGRLSVVPTATGAGAADGARPAAGGAVAGAGFTAGEGRQAVRQRRSRDSSRWLAIVGGIAAAAVVVGGVVALGRGSSQKSASLAGPAQFTTTTTAVSASPAARVDLGDQSDPAALARLVVGALSPTGPGSVGSADLGVATSTGQGEVPNAGPSSAAPSSNSASSNSAPSSNSTQPLCLAQARAALGLADVATAVVRYDATLHWKGQPAVVLVFSRPGGLAGVVMKTADCSALVVLPV